MKVVTSAQMASLEQASERRGVSTDTLMENAGLAVARAARECLASVAGARVLVLVGPGNNGADGLVAARHLQRWGAQVTAYVVSRRPDPDPKMTRARE
jgi:ADP-dependent NAD(P)H-hydrate dehydratase / NAD(P)H-hydrate epimerase